jgi:hypothetical protein
LDDNGFLIKGTQYRIIPLVIVLVVRERVVLLMIFSKVLPLGE